MAVDVSGAVDTKPPPDSRADIAGFFYVAADRAHVADEELLVCSPLFPKCVARGLVDPAPRKLKSQEEEVGAAAGGGGLSGKKGGKGTGGGGGGS